jgi:hypothetical protein
MTEALDEHRITDAVRRWLDDFVVGLSLCPFAAAPLAAGRVRLSVTPATSADALLQALLDELRLLDEQPAVETTLLIHPLVLQAFDDYNQFLDLADALLAETGHEGIYQVASFHPAYRFAGTAPEAAENFTNRSPYPMLHLLREESVARAVESPVDTDAVPERNIDLMNEIGATDLRRRLADLLADRRGDADSQALP